MSLRAEFQQFRDKWTAAAADGKVTLDEICDVGIELIDVVAIPYDALDLGNQAAIDALADEVSELAKEIVENMPRGRFLGKSAVVAGIGFGVPWVIQQAAAAGSKLRPWVEENILPKTRSVESLLHHFNSKLAA